MLQTKLGKLGHFKPRGLSTFTKCLLGAGGALFGYSAFYQYTQYTKLNQTWHQIKESVEGKDPITIEGFDAKAYPWVRENNVKDWEFKQVRIRGYFKDQRFFVRRRRDGKEGYLVFAPFVTAVENVNHRIKQKSLLPIEYSIFVNLGWVPQENKKDVELGGEVCPPIV